MHSLVFAWHFFLFVWTHHHHIADLQGWLRTLYPWWNTAQIRTYAAGLVHAYGTGPALLDKISPG